MNGPEESENQSYPIPEKDSERLVILESYLVLDTLPEVAFDRITSFAKRLFGVEIALLSLVDEKRQWFKSKQGLATCQTDRSSSFCTYAITETAPDVFIVLDARKDARFCNNPLVTGPPYIQFYAGAPLLVEHGLKIGTLCIISSSSRDIFSIREKMDLTDLAAMVVDELKLRRHTMRASLKYITSTSEDLKTPLLCFSIGLEKLGETSLSKEQRSVLDHAKGNVELMEWTIKNALAATKFQNPSSEFRPVLQLVNIPEIFKKLKNIATYFPKLVPLTFAINEAVPQELFSNASCIIHSLLNFITNSCKLTTEGSIQVEATSSSAEDEEGESDALFETVRFSVVDSGPGVENPNILFKPVFGHIPLDNPAKNEQGMTKSGSGVGLHSVLVHMQSVGGRCGYQQRLDGTNGSIFWIEVPNIPPPSDMVASEGLDLPPLVRCATITSTNPNIANATIDSVTGFANISTTVEDNSAGEAQCTLTSARSATPREKPPLPSLSVVKTSSRTVFRRAITVESRDVNHKRKRALVIDDNLTIRKTLKILLHKLGLHVDSASHGEAGLELLKERGHTYSIVFCDFLMPVLSGPECIKQYISWRKDNPSNHHKPFIVGISANADNADVSVGLSAGMDCFEPKPVKPNRIKELCEAAHFKGLQTSPSNATILQRSFHSLHSQDSISVSSRFDRSPEESALFSFYERETQPLQDAVIAGSCRENTGNKDESSAPFVFELTRTMSVEQSQFEKLQLQQAGKPEIGLMQSSPNHVRTSSKKILGRCMSASLLPKVTAKEKGHSSIFGGTSSKEQSFGSKSMDFSITSEQSISLCNSVQTSSEHHILKAQKRSGKKEGGILESIANSARKLSADTLLQPQGPGKKELPGGILQASANSPRKLSSATPVQSQGPGYLGNNAETKARAQSVTSHFGRFPKLSR